MTKQQVTFLDEPTVFFDTEAYTDSLDGWYNRCYFCTQCGTVWAQWITEGRTRFFAVHRSCRKHAAPAYASERPGSLLMCLREDLAVLPPELLVREFGLSENLNQLPLELPNETI